MPNMVTHWSPPRKGERRRRYVVTALMESGETIDDADQRVVESLGATRDSTKITVSVYDPATNEFVALAGGR